MKYFLNPTTEEELKNQYRNLLIKNDYRSEKNAPVIQEIKKEYEEALLQIKRANGYRTLTEKAVDGVKEVYTEYQNIKKEEEQRINHLKNRKYSKSDIQILITKTKTCISKIIRSALKRDDSNYIFLRKNISYFDDEYVCRWFNTHTDIFVSRYTKNEYDNIREVLEYALKSQTSDKKSQESYMLQMEKLIGKHIKNTFKKYESELIDPIIVADYSTQEYAEKKLDKKFKGFSRKIVIWVGIACFIYVTFSILIDKHISEKTELILFYAIFIVIGVLVLLWLVNLLNSGFENKFNRKRLDGIGELKRKSRVSERKQYFKDLGTFGIIKFIMSLFLK